MSIYYSKEGLYREVSNLKKSIGLDEDEYKFDLINICKNNDILIENVNFKTNSLKGIASIGQLGKQDVILLNCNKNDMEKNFICCHELIHLELHRNCEQKEFNCFEKVLPKQNPFYEYQANEGAAEMFVPYKVLLPIIRNNYEWLNTGDDFSIFKKKLAACFQVTQMVIEFRLESLKYEINQHLAGVKIEDIKILSLSQQAKKNIKVESINDIERNLFFNEIFG